MLAILVGFWFETNLEQPADVAKNEKDIMRAFLHSIAVTKCELGKLIESKVKSIIISFQTC